jgi:hypothetical protein
VLPTATAKTHRKYFYATNGSLTCMLGPFDLPWLWSDPSNEPRPLISHE